MAFVAQTFGYLTAVEEAVKVLTCAHTEARSVHNGLGIEMLVLERKHIDPDGIWWKAVLAGTGQPARFE